MRDTPVPVSLVGDADPLANLDGLHLRGVDRATKKVDRTYLDTFDRRLEAKGWTLWRERASERRGARCLRLEGGAEPSLTVALEPARDDRLLVEELPPGRARDRLAGVVERRALLPLARVRGSLRELAVCNEDEKTVVRVEILDGVAVGPRVQGQPSERRVRITPVLGYDREFAAVVAAARAAGFSPVRRLAEAAAHAWLPVSPAPPLRRGTRADDAAVAMCRWLADVVDRNLPGTLADLDAEFLHDLRVAVRRSRSVLKEMRDVFPQGAGAAARDDLRWIQAVTGPTRDLDVQLEGWPQLTEGLRRELTVDLQPVVDLLARHRAGAFVEMRAALESARFRRSWSRWHRLIEDPPFGGEPGGPLAGVPIECHAGRRIRKVYRSMTEMGAAVSATSPPEALHELRKRGKELRYLLELFGRLWPSEAVGRLVADLKRLQDVLGRFQDDQIEIVFLRGLGPELAASPGGTDSLIALGLVVDALARDQRRARAEFDDRFSAFSSRRTRRLVRDTFADRAEVGAGSGAAEA